MTTPLPHALARKRQTQEINVRCPTCNRYHYLHREFGPFCCLSCLQYPIRPLIFDRKGNYASR